MSKLVRFGVSLDRDLLKKFDTRSKNKKYTNRSEAIRDLIREDLIKKEWQENEKIAGAIILIYDHHKRKLLNRITDIQHNFQEIIISTQHVHFDHNNCLEVLAVKGYAKEVVALTDSLRSINGVKHCALSMSTTGKDLV